MKIAYILGEFPSNSEYFIHQEIIQLEKRGFDIDIFALKKAGRYNTLVKPRAPIIYCNVISFDNIKAYLWYFFKVSIQSAHFNYVSLSREILGNKHNLVVRMKMLKDFHISLFFCYRSRDVKYDLIHAHFFSYPARVALWMSAFKETPFSISVHAQDIFTSNQFHRTLESSRFFITCNEQSKKYLLDKVNTVSSLTNRIHAIYHGVNVSYWKRDLTPVTRVPLENETIHLLSVGRLVEKKGIIYLLKAVKLLVSDGFGIRCTIAGSGPLFEDFASYIKESNLTKYVFLVGNISQQSVYNLYCTTDIFVLPCIISNNGDRDGLPNVLLESLAMEVPVITTNVSAISELITSGETGLLVPQHNEKAIADAILTLMKNRSLYERLQRNGRKVVEEKFDLEKCIDKLCAVLLGDTK